jgi:hypothetical protein
VSIISIPTHYICVLTATSKTTLPNPEPISMNIDLSEIPIDNIELFNFSIDPLVASPYVLYESVVFSLN